MKALKAKINWYDNFVNSGRLCILTEEPHPDISEFCFIKRNDCYWAQHDGWVWFFHYSAPGNGFSGYKFNIHVYGDTMEELIGPWSSNSAYMESIGFPPSVPVHFTNDINSWEKGYTFTSGHIILPKALEICSSIGVSLLKTNNGYVPVKLGCKPSIFELKED